MKLTILADENDRPVVGRTEPKHNDLIREVWSDGATVERRYWDAALFPIDPASEEKKQIAVKLAELDRVTMHRAMEAWAKVNGDRFVKDAIAEKETLRQRLATLE